jgi:HAMP domain-containing protein
VEQARITRTIAIAILFGFAGICVGFALFFAGFITRPLRGLAAAAGRMAAGELDVGALRVESADEVGALTLSFNSMNAHIVALVRDLKEKAALERRLHREELRNSMNQKMRKEAEFLALQARINPHFLFNTLNTISRDVMLRGGKDTVALVDALSALLRYGLEQGSGIVSLATELEIVRKYAFIQHYRFDNRVSIEIDCRLRDPEAVRLPAFSIQPLVENAFIHGLEPKLERRDHTGTSLRAGRGAAHSGVRQWHRPRCRPPERHTPFSGKGKLGAHLVHRPVQCARPAQALHRRPGQLQHTEYGRRRHPCRDSPEAEASNETRPAPANRGR